VLYSIQSIFPKDLTVEENAIPAKQSMINQQMTVADNVTHPFLFFFFVIAGFSLNYTLYTISSKI
jgi:hypothetical protein